MVHINVTKNNFSSGEIGEDYYGRTDLALHRDGAKRLENVDIMSSGGLQRRSGLRRLLHVGRGLIQTRLHSYRGENGEDYLLLFINRNLKIYQTRSDGSLSSPTSLSTIWNSYDLKRLNFTHSGNFLLICHPEYPPQKLAKKSRFELSEFVPKTMQSGSLKKIQHRFADKETTAQVKDSSRNSSTNKYEGTILFNPDIPAFRTYQARGIRLMIENYEVELMGSSENGRARFFGVSGSRHTRVVKDWSEDIFSKLHGYPISACFHQGRLVLAGSKDLPNNLWMSKTAEYEDFSLGEGEDDSGIDVKLSTADGEKINHVVSARHLQIFTSRAEWTISDEPITPTNITAVRQTHIGTPTDKAIAPFHVNGATIFCAADGSLREYVYTDIESAYAVNDLNSLAPPLGEVPQDLDYDAEKRRAYCILTDGSIRVLALYHQEKIIAWTRYSTAHGKFIAFANCGKHNYAITTRQLKNDYGSLSNDTFLEVFDAKTPTDYTSAITSSSYTIEQLLGLQSISRKLDHYFRNSEFHLLLKPNDANQYKYLASLADSPTNSVFNTNRPSHFSYSTSSYYQKQNLVLPTSMQKFQWASQTNQFSDSKAYTLEAGFPIHINIQSTPISSEGQNNFQRYRLISATFHSGEGTTLVADTGLGAQTITSQNSNDEYSNELAATNSELKTNKVKQTGWGWTDIGQGSAWSINQNDARPFILLSVEMRLSLN